MNQRLLAPLIASLLATAVVTAHADTATINTTATILATCKFRSIPTALAFPDIDPGSDEPVTQNARVEFSCTKDSTVQFAVNDSTSGTVNGSLSNGTHSLGYTVSWAAPTNLSAAGRAKGHSQANWASVQLNGSIAKEAFQDAAAGAYSDVTGLKLSVNP